MMSSRTQARRRATPVTALAAAAALSLLWLAPAAQASNLLVNGSFETGDLTGWAPSGALVVNTLTTTDGVYAVNLGNGFNLRHIEQTLPTLAGTLYGIGLDLGALSPGTANTRGDRLLVLDAGGAELLNVLLQTPGAFTSPSAPAFSAHSHSFTALGSATRIRLETEWYTSGTSSVVDNVVVQALTSPIPEPGSLALWLAGLAGMAGVGCRSRRSAARGG